MGYHHYFCFFVFLAITVFYTFTAVFVVKSELGVEFILPTDP
jgi:hypothetical protein